MNHNETSNDVRVAIIGAGFAGLCMAVQLRKHGIEDFVILERAADIGGVWRENVYPGAACDVPAVLYSYSFEQGYPWTQAYPPQAEILGYMRHVVEKYDLAKHLRFGVKVCGASFDASAARWTVATLGGPRFSCAALVPAVGIFNEPMTPSITGIADFEGEILHSARWPRQAALDGRRVAVIGTGASAIQIVPEVAKRAAELTLYQRTAPYVVPKATIDPSDAAAERARVFAEFEIAARRRSDFEVTAKAQAAFADYLANQVPDPVLRAKLTPPFVMGCKRTLFSNHWYQALQGDNVHVETEAIEKLTANGILARNGTQRPFDVIVFATGFDPSNYLPGIDVVGSKGRKLNDTWHEGAEAYLGIAVPGFPNMFLMYGPNTNVAGSIIYMLECQAEYIVKALELMHARNTGTMEVTEEAYRGYSDTIQAQLSDSTLAASHCQSYFMNAAGRIVTNYPGTSLDYRHATEIVDPSCFHFG
ncbi:MULTISPECIES: flavin-containing monooxygenase [Variovorax]|jgi:cation diffusion facilitator CzcD-associated flavoprotein CzcO|uniref:flavin-containing monooxygenase n=1 Tax=Variovorax TaxID=34072 RepID=UPI00086DBDCB|nr:MULTISPECIES: NAD(P)/FAD-dependent oxidoreductase [Variovorax]ODS94715.1 MAG: hypothetical protein ABS56_17465 [Lautropia sp. SCN 69-89]MBN8751802.1 NAD(P)/FAD-dependent oxidoreductase [Variovorax sp.]ODV15390.1 MAG: hypothetical protein ABT25_32645 [Variovorax sp. SCN 67-20]OJZ12726.1 MAG: hypothetical protein BGP22_22450 [Variovorax sp. 67-131]UKI07784.1 NAD(P)/FAD-dependent oxidoreductase [Variovorax paradoxus]